MHFIHQQGLTELFATAGLRCLAIRCAASDAPARTAAVRDCCAIYRCGLCVHSEISEQAQSLLNSCNAEEVTTPSSFRPSPRCAANVGEGKVRRMCGIYHTVTGLLSAKRLGHIRKESTESSTPSAGWGVTVSGSKHEAGACVQDQPAVITSANTTQVSITLPWQLLHRFAQL